MNLIFKDITNYCNDAQITLSEQQALVLQIICQHEEAVNAQEILENLKTINTKANRMTIHRALEYLNKAGIIHKISFNNTYVPCTHLEQHNCQLLVCIKCNKKIEFSSSKILQSLKKAAQEYHFFINSPLEIMGYCQGCLQSNM